MIPQKHTPVHAESGHKTDIRNKSFPAIAVRCDNTQKKKKLKDVSTNNPWAWRRTRENIHGRAIKVKARHFQHRYFKPLSPLVLSRKQKPQFVNHGVSHRFHSREVEAMRTLTQCPVKPEKNKNKRIKCAPVQRRRVVHRRDKRGSLRRLDGKTGGGSPGVAIQTVHGGLLDEASADQVVIDVRLPRHLGDYI